MGRRAHVRLDDPLAPPRARLRRAHRLFRSHDPRRSRKPPAQANSSRIGVFKRTLRQRDQLPRVEAVRQNEDVLRAEVDSVGDCKTPRGMDPYSDKRKPMSKALTTKRRRMIPLRTAGAWRLALLAFAVLASVPIAAEAAAPRGDRSGTAEARALRTLSQMSRSEKLALVRGLLGAPWGGRPKPEGAVGSAGYVAGIPRLGIPALQETDGALGVANPGGIRRGDTATAMPANLALA